MVTWHQLQACCDWPKHLVSVLTPLIATQKAVQDLTILSSPTAWPLAGFTQPVQLLSSVCAEQEGKKAGSKGESRESGLQEGREKREKESVMLAIWNTTNSQWMHHWLKKVAVLPSPILALLGVISQLTLPSHDRYINPWPKRLPCSFLSLKWFSSDGLHSLLQTHTGQALRYSHCAMKRVVKGAINFLRTAWFYLSKAN